MAEWPNSIARKSHEWRQGNHFLPKGVRCIETDTGREKVGDGNRWSDTPYLSADSILDAVPRNEAARYFVPTLNEIHKASRYDPTLNAGAGGYWNYGTKSDSLPGLATIDDKGVGQMTNADNTANWGGASNWANDPYQRSYSDVGTNGAPSYYGIYDVDGNAFDMVEDAGSGGPGTQRICNGSIHTDPVEWNAAYSSCFQFDNLGMPLKFNTWGLRIASTTNPDLLPNFVSVGNVDNPAQSKGASNNNMEGYGAVAYEFKCNKFYVTHTEYVEFLNAIGETDEHGVYASVFSGNGTGPSSGTLNGILRRGAPGNYYYEAMENWANKPAGYFNFVTAARYCNWLHNGKPVGPQIAATTEDGAYTLNGNVTTIAARNS